MRAITLERGQLLYLLLCVHFRQLFSGPQHKGVKCIFWPQRWDRPAISGHLPHSVYESGNHQREAHWWINWEPNLPPALIHRTLLRDKIEHSSIINRLTVTLCHNNNPVTQGRMKRRAAQLHITARCQWRIDAH